MLLELTEEEQIYLKDIMEGLLIVEDKIPKKFRTGKSNYINSILEKLNGIKK